MRLWEAVHIATVAASSLFLARCAPSTSIVLLASCVSLLAQQKYEGFRWQLWPLRAALALNTAGFTLLVHQSGFPSPVSQGAMSWAAVLAIRVIACVSLLPAAASLLLTTLIPVFRIPRTTGLFPVSMVDIELHDPQRPEWMPPWSEDTERPRRLVVRLVYPTEHKQLLGKRCKRVPYFGHLHLRASAIAAHKKFPAFALEHMIHVNSNAWVQPDGTPLPVLRTTAGPLPVIIFSHGYSGTYDSHTAIIEDLASHGYVVASISHTHDALTTVFASTGEVVLFNATAPKDMLHDVEALRQLRQSQLQVRVDDVAFVIQQLELLNKGQLKPACSTQLSEAFSGALDMGRLCVMGHSFGGATAVQAMCDIPAVKAAVGLDAWTFALPSRIKQGGLQKPALFIQADKFFISHTPFGRDNMDEVLGLLRRPDGDEVLAGMVSVPGAFHADFTDLALFAPVVTRYAKVTKLPGELVQSIVMTMCLGFLQHALQPRLHEVVQRPLAFLSKRAAVASGMQLQLTC